MPCISRPRVAERRARATEPAQHRGQILPVQFLFRVCSERFDPTNANNTCRMDDGGKISLKKLFSKILSFFPPWCVRLAQTNCDRNVYRRVYMGDQLQWFSLSGPSQDHGCSDRVQCVRSRYVRQRNRFEIKVWPYTVRPLLAIITRDSHRRQETICS
jgi:hypothetical protein